MELSGERPYGYKWRSSRSLVVSTACIALFAETLLYSFLAPILPYMLEVRLHGDPSQTQDLITRLLSLHGFMTLISTPFVAAFSDSTATRRTPLLTYLAVCIIGTVLVAASPTIWALYLGRVLQGIAGAGAWIAGMAMLTENVDEGSIGKMMGLCMSFVMFGVISGPIIAGALLELAGYWLAWSVPLVVLLIDVIMRFVMIEPEKGVSENKKNDTSVTEGLLGQREDTADTDTESSPLLSPKPGADAESTQPQAQTVEDDAPSGGFYTIMLRDGRVLASLLCVTTFSTITAGFNATFPVHLRQIFNWGPFPVGVAFFAMRSPSILLGPLSGSLRDRIGLRDPTTAGWSLFAPLLLCMGVPGEFPWSSAETHGKAIFVASIIGIGIVQNLLQNAGFLNILVVVQEYEFKYPKIFGANGGRGRAFGLTEMSFNMGLIVGPILSGSLSQVIGFFYMNAILGLICIGNAVAVFSTFAGRKQRG
ncbi:hypothetical protein N7495_004360 [Penicillium taxi]|uniref:uncharacterized protein n=1 Tax=Penicillium taxi TaxID=168475 RepID=UPI002545368B|nr:uncharacterized protein N7495_004360 [Penicillium taxi]KAJ5899616.1 hypothetical protein N7495_004360 [Penicillium taxi]